MIAQFEYKTTYKTLHLLFLYLFTTVLISLWHKQQVSSRTVYTFGPPP